MGRAINSPLGEGHVMSCLREQSDTLRFLANASLNVGERLP